MYRMVLYGNSFFYYGADLSIIDRSHYNMIQFEHVSKSYGKTKILEDLNFTIPDGQFVVLIGPSGCGKTTTMKMIN